MDKWAYERDVKLDFSRPGKPTDNTGVESFNGPLRQEGLNANWFCSLVDAQNQITAWRVYYNESRSHSALEWTHTRRIRPALLPASSNGDVKGAGSSCFRAGLNSGQTQ